MIPHKEKVVYNFTLFAQPMGKKRAKFARIGKFVHTYSPKENVAYEEQIRQAFKDANTNATPLETPLYVAITACFGVPTSFSAKKRQACLNREILPVVKPDVDNISKIILDALNEVAYKDDKQVVELFIEKTYSDTPHIEVTIGEL